MRASVTLALFLAALIASGPLHAQGKKEKEKAAVTSRTILADLQVEMNSQPFRETIKLSDFLALMHDQLQARGKAVSFVVAEEAYRDENADAPALLDQQITLRNLPAKASANHLLRQALKQMPMKSAFVIRAGKVEIVPLSRTAKEYMLNQTFHVDFSERRLDQALEELSELTGVSIIVDVRAKQKLQTAITARFHDDVALQDAVRMLTDMAELKVVYLVTGLYITTPEHAPVMRKELKALYEPTAERVEMCIPGLPGIGFPGMGGAPPPLLEPSPLSPPLPPSIKKRVEAAQ